MFMKEVDFGKMERIREEEKTEGRDYRKMVFHEKVEEEDSEEVSDTDSVYQWRMDTFKNMFHPSDEETKKRA